jgi:hypothetical protein
MNLFASSYHELNSSPPSVLCIIIPPPSKLCKKEKIYLKTHNHKITTTISKVDMKYVIVTHLYFILQKGFKGGQYFSKPARV